MELIFSVTDNFPITLNVVCLNELKLLIILILCGKKKKLLVVLKQKLSIIHHLFKLQICQWKKMMMMVLLVFLGSGCYNYVPSC